MVKILKLFLLLSFAGFQVSAQAWLPGYNYRKKITINKAMVSGTSNLAQFQLLVALEDQDLRYVAANCSGNKISGSKGRDFAFTMVSAPQTPLSYQLDDYVAATGKLVSWVRLPSLAASGSTTAATQIYLYYGSNNIHFPKAAAAQQTWNNDQDRIWHMNPEPAGISIVNGASSNAAEGLRPGKTMTTANYVPGKIGNAIYLNGSNQQLSSGRLNGTNFFISCWIKIDSIGREQVILGMDSTATSGFVLKLGASGQLIQEIRSTSSVLLNPSSLVLVANRWYHLVSSIFGNRRDIYIDGVNYYGGLSSVNMRQGGSLVVGSSKGNDKYFGGIIDELRIQTITTNPSLELIKTSYVNQHDPAAFYVVSAEEKNNAVIRTGMVFSNVRNQSWDEPANWNSLEVPGRYEQVILGPRTRLSAGLPAGLTLSKLSLEAGAVLMLDQDVEILCDANIEANARLSIRDGAYLQLDGKVVNQGWLESRAAALSGGLRFSGAATQSISGAGQVSVEAILLDKASHSAMLQLEQPVSVTGSVRATMGVLHANGYLTLKHSGASKQAFLWSIPAPAQAAVVGEVTVEQLASGNFPAPATARGWRLWSSPVYHGSSAGSSYYHLYDFLAAMFVTGPGGSRNGFDDSPQNGHTIYTHNQAVVGSLSQKYSGIPGMISSVDLGRGIYVFSRGDRQSPDAYARQVQTPPFESPGSYIIQHKGLLFQGSLQLELQNRNMGAAGDGFHLLGNPYAAVLRWADLQKENLSPYLWKFNPLNNAYDVSNDLKTTINAGEGFFVKVLNGHARGSIAFGESAKLNSSTGLMELKQGGEPVGLETAQANVRRGTTDRKLAAVSANRSVTAKHTPATSATGGSRIGVVLSREVFEQQYTLLLEPGGNDEVDDQDATSLGTGYVSISGLAGAGTKLSVDTRELPGRRQLEVPLFVKGYATGKYQLRITGIVTLEAGTTMILKDRYLNSQTVLSEQQVYEFEMNPAVEASFGEQRFSLLIRPRVTAEKPDVAATTEGLEVLIYPNPFQHGFALKLPAVSAFRLELRLRDLMGHLVLRRNFGLVNGTDVLHLDAPGLASGAYLLELFNLDTNRPVQTSKLIKR